MWFCSMRISDTYLLFFLLFCRFYWLLTNVANLGVLSFGCLRSVVFGLKNGGVGVWVWLLKLVFLFLNPFLNLFLFIGDCQNSLI